MMLMHFMYVFQPMRYRVPPALRLAFAQHESTQFYGRHALEPVDEFRRPWGICEARHAASRADVYGGGS